MCGQSLWFRQHPFGDRPDDQIAILGNTKLQAVPLGRRLAQLRIEEIGEANRRTMLVKRDGSPESAHVRPEPLILDPIPHTDRIPSPIARLSTPLCLRHIPKRNTDWPIEQGSAEKRKRISHIVAYRRKAHDTEISVTDGPVVKIERRGRAPDALLPSNAIKRFG
jgi:hypothetical protein